MRGAHPGTLATLRPGGHPAAMLAPTPDQVRARLDELREARGFVLPHHGLMAAALPELHAGYEAMYRALTLDPRHLAPLERETVWLAILAACEEPVGTHHLRKFQQSGGSEAQALAIFRLAAWAAGAPRYATLDASWSGQFGTPMRDAYRDGARVLLAPLNEPLARIALAAIQAANDQEWGLAVEIEAALACGATEAQLSEALSYVIWPRGVNRFVRAAECWLGLIRAGRVPASPAFAAWAAMPDQGPLRL
jgi:alkylhydroperoxidase/carboxymuconolactone decarboxylase family protein YurZ